MRRGSQTVEKQAKSTLYFMYFCVTKSTKSHLRRSLLEISLPFPTLPKREQYTPSCANISRELSDLGQRQKCRLECTGCLLAFALCHADTAGVPTLPKRAQHLGSVSVQTSYTPAVSFMRAWNQRIRESARFFRVMCSHAWYRESHGERQTLLSCFAHLPHSLATQ